MILWLSKVCDFLNHILLSLPQKYKTVLEDVIMPKYGGKKELLTPY